MATSYSWATHPGRASLSSTVPLASAFRTRAAPQAAPVSVTPADRAAAFGVSTETEEARRKRTGVDRGGDGYNSGQVSPYASSASAPAPAQSAAPAPATPPTNRANPATSPGAGGWSNRPPSTRPWGAPTPPPRPPAPSATNTAAGTPRTGTAPTPTADDVTTQQSALTAGAPPTDDVTTRQSAITSTQPTSVVPTSTDPRFRLDALGTDKNTTGSNTGTTQGETTVPTGGSASPTVRVLNEISPGLGDSLDPGSNYVEQYFTPKMADLGPTQAATAAAFGTSENLNVERYNYRPGAAPAQDRVALDLAAQNEIRARQNQSLDALTGAANGTIPSAAEIQMRQQAGRDHAATLGAARALGGRSAGGAARAASVANANNDSRNQVAGAELRRVEQAQARQQLVQALSGARGQDIDVASGNANLAQAANANNLQAQQRQDQLAEEHRKMLLDAQLKAMGIGADSAGDTVTAASANAAGQNKAQGETIGAFAKLIGM